MKVSFIFEAGAGGWSEQWYSDEADATSAFNRLNTNAFMTGFFAPRGAGVSLIAMRISDVAVPRSAQVFSIEVSRAILGMSVGVSDDAPQEALMISCTLAPTGQRTILLRGLKDYNYKRDNSGAFVPSTLQIADVNAFINSVNVLGALKTRHLIPPATINPDRLINQLSVGDANGQSTLVSYTGTAPIVGQRVIFHKLPFNEFPGLKGVHPVTTLQTNAFTVPVRFTSPLTPFPIAGGLWRFADYDYRRILSFFLKDIREKKIGRPFDSPRGRSRGVRYAPR
jgi:hypothetical protein